MEIHDDQIRSDVSVYTYNDRTKCGRTGITFSHTKPGGH